MPPALVLATDAFDHFMTENNLLDFALQCEDDSEILQRFLAAPLSAELEENLKVFLAEVTYPLAVRSSSLLEDSQYQPFTGVYETFMLGNQQADTSRTPGGVDRGHQACLRFHLQPVTPRLMCAPLRTAWKKKRWR